LRKSAVALTAAVAAALLAMPAPPWAAAVRESWGQAAFFRPPVNVSRSSFASRLARTSPRSLVLDAQGPAYLIWVETVPHTGGTAHELALSQFLVGAGWDTLVPVGRWEGEPSTEPATAIDQNHALHLVWLEQKAAANQVKSLQFNLLTGKASEAISISESGHNAADPAVAVEADGRVNVIWSEIADGQSVLRHRWYAAAGWGPATTVPTGPGTGAFSPDLAGDAWGYLHLVWTRGVPAGSIPVYARRSPNGEWGPPESLAAERPEWFSGPPVVSVGEDRVWVAWAESDGKESRVMTRVRTGGRWSTARSPSRPGVNAEQPSAAVDAWGTLHLVWLDQSPASTVLPTAIAYSSCTTGDTVFAEPRLLTPTGPGPFVNPTIACDESGRVLAAWVDQGVGGDIFCRSGVAGFTALAPEFWHRP